MSGRYACCDCCEGNPTEPCNDAHANGPHVEPCANGCNDHDDEEEADLP